MIEIDFSRSATDFKFGLILADIPSFFVLNLGEQKDSEEGYHTFDGVMKT